MAMDTIKRLPIEDRIELIAMLTLSLEEDAVNVSVSTLANAIVYSGLSDDRVPGIIEHLKEAIATVRWLNAEEETMQ
jgi:hypothetical protein